MEEPVALGPGEQGGWEDACVHADISVYVWAAVCLSDSEAPFPTCDPGWGSFQVTLRVSPAAPRALGSGGSPW